MTLAQLEHVDRRAKIVIENLAAARLAIHAREDARIGGGINDPVKCGKAFEIRSHAQITVENFDAAPFQFLAVRFAAGPRKIIHAHDGQRLTAARLILQHAGEGGANETTNAGDENFHCVRPILARQACGKARLSFSLCPV